MLFRIIHICVKYFFIFFTVQTYLYIFKHYENIFFSLIFQVFTNPDVFGKLSYDLLFYVSEVIS